MIARVEARRRFQVPAIAGNNWPGRALPRVWVLIGGLFLLVAAWTIYRVWFHPTLFQRFTPVLAELIGLVETAAFFTLAVLWFAVWWRRGQVTARQPRSIELEQLQQLTPGAFEEFVADLFVAKGYQVRLRGRSGDHGVDLELIKPGGKRAIVQCKRHRNKLGPKVARELYGTLVHEKAAHAFLVTTADISDATRRWARGKSMTLVDGTTLVQVAAKLSGEVNRWMKSSAPARPTNELRPTMPPPTLGDSN